MRGRSYNNERGNLEKGEIGSTRGRERIQRRQRKALKEEVDLIQGGPISLWGFSGVRASCLLCTANLDTLKRNELASYINIAGIILILI